MDEQSNQLDQPIVPEPPDQSYPTSPSSLPYPYPVAYDQQQYPTQPPYQTYPSQPLNAPQTYPQQPTNPPQSTYPPAAYPPQAFVPQPYPMQPYAAQPYPAQYPPQPSSVIYTQNQSFTGKAVIAFLLYFLFYVPGLIFNIMFINEAHQVQKETGRTPSGLGCLWATLIVSIAPLALFFVIIVLFIIGLAAGSGGAS